MDTFAAITQAGEYVLVLGPATPKSRGIRVLTDNGTITCTTDSLIVRGDLEARYRVSLFAHFLSKCGDEKTATEYYAGSIALRAKHLASKRPCDTCLEAKPLDQFYKRSREADGIDNICKACRTEANARAYQEKTQA